MKQLFLTLITLAIWSYSYAQPELLVKQAGNFDAFEEHMDSIRTSNLLEDEKQPGKNYEVDLNLQLDVSNLEDVYILLPESLLEPTCCFCFHRIYANPDTLFNKYTHPEHIQMLLDNYLKNPTQAWSKEYQQLEHKLKASQAENLRLKLYIGVAFLLNLLLGIWVVRRFFQQRYV